MFENFRGNDHQTLTFRANWPPPLDIGTRPASVSFYSFFHGAPLQLAPSRTSRIPAYVLSR